MAIKFKMISNEDVKAIRTARKALTRIARKLRKLDAAEKEARDNPNKDTTPVALAHWRMLDEVEALGVVSSDDDLRFIRLLPSGVEAEGIRI